MKTKIQINNVNITQYVDNSICSTDLVRKAAVDGSVHHFGFYSPPKITSEIILISQNFKQKKDQEDILEAVNE